MCCPIVACCVTISIERDQLVLLACRNQKCSTSFALMRLISGVPSYQHPRPRNAMLHGDNAIFYLCKWPFHSCEPSVLYPRPPPFSFFEPAPLPGRKRMVSETEWAKLGGCLHGTSNLLSMNVGRTSVVLRSDRRVERRLNTLN